MVTLKSQLISVVVLLILLFGCLEGIVFIWDNSIVPAMNQYEKDKGECHDHS